MFLKCIDYMNRPVIINITGISLIEVASVKGQEDGSVVFLDYREEPLFLQTDVETLFSYLSLYADEYSALEVAPKPSPKNTLKVVALPGSSQEPSNQQPEGTAMKKGSKGKGKTRPC
jgi:hypothetical protein